MPNPYLPLLDQTVAQLLASDPVQRAQEQCAAAFVHWDRDNEWVSTHLAGYLMTAAMAWQWTDSRWHRSEPVAELARRLLGDLVERGYDNRWWHREGRKGDPNIDRFAVVPFMEALLLAPEAFADELTQAALERVSGVLERQLAEYGRSSSPRIYPNMDVYYCLTMLLGHLLTGNEQYLAEHERFVGLMEAAQFAEGAWTYINGTNECPVYHNLNVMLMARIWGLSGQARALAMIERSVPYYPQVVDPAGRPEYFTDPWWKHSWARQDPFAPDTVASLAGDAANRQIGEQLREGLEHRLGELGGQVDLPQMVWAALGWRAVERATPVSRLGVSYDGNIEGPRGRFAGWSWAATARHGSDTLVGAVAHTPRDEPPVALMAVTPEVDRRHEGRPNEFMQRWSLGITPPDTRGQTECEGDTAVFTADYSLACFRSIWDAHYFPARWRCRQRWEMNASELRGELELVSEVRQAEAPPLVRVRFGRNLELRESSPGEYRCGPFVLRVTPGDFPQAAIRQVPSVPYLTTEDAVELVLYATDRGPYQAGQSFRCALTVSYCG